ncbi:MAG: DUF4198 domain-containing protein [Asticcacaulis sp.]
MPRFKYQTGLALMAAALALTAPISAQAHRQWIAPAVSQLEGKTPYVSVDAAISENLFEIDSFPLKLDGLTVTGPDGQPVTPENLYEGKMRSAFDLQLRAPGTYKIAVATKSVMGSYKLAGETKRFRGTEDELATQVPKDAEDLKVTRTLGRVESFVTYGKPNATALAATGVGLEMVPVTHPSEYIAGEPAQFQMWLDGKPAANLAVTIVPGNVKYRDAIQDTSVTTDAKGEFTVTWPLAERYWIGASYPPREAAEPGQPREQPAMRYSYTATVDVLPN